MKKILFIPIIILILFSLNSNAQRATSIYKNNLKGESIEISGGIHTGVFDSNHAGIPFNIGIVSQFKYIPNIEKRWFIGVEGGLFYARSGIDKYNRQTNDVFVDFSIFPGVKILLKKPKYKNDTKKTKVLKKGKFIKVGVGFTVTTPLRKRSSGSRVNTDAIKPGLGISLRTSYDLKNRLSLFGIINRVGRDLDGYSNKDTSSIKPSDDNKHSVTYVFKLGVLWSIYKH